MDTQRQDRAAILLALDDVKMARIIRNDALAMFGHWTARLTKAEAVLAEAKARLASLQGEED